MKLQSPLSCSLGTWSKSHCSEPIALNCRGACKRLPKSPAVQFTCHSRRSLAAQSGHASCHASQGQHVVVVGAGIGGLLVAGQLQRSGFRVTLLEQNGQVGGRCCSQELQPGFRFDTGPSLLLFPGKYREAFDSLGADISDHVEMLRVEPSAYRVFFPGHGSSTTGSSSPTGTDKASSSSCSTLDLMYDCNRMVAQFEAVEPGAGTQYLRWLAAAHTMLQVGTANFIARDFGPGLRGVAEFLEPRRLLPLLGQLDFGELLGQHHDRLARRFKDPRLRALLSFQDLYVGLSPYSAPGVFSLLAATEITDGVYYPRGGFGMVVAGLLSVIQSLGVQVRTRARVQSIDVQSGRASGVTLAGGEHIPASLVVCNRDLPSAYGLVRHPHGKRRQRRLARKQYSAGVIAFNWCLDKRLDKLPHHSVFLSDEFERSWTRATDGSTLRRRPNFYVHAPSRTDPSAAPDGKDSIMVLLPVANMQERAAGAAAAAAPTAISSSSAAAGGGTVAAEDYRELAEAGRSAVLRTFVEAGVGDVAPHILHEKVIQPQEWRERYGLQHGAAFGLSHGLDQLALLRPPVKDDMLRGLYFVGASTRPGNGVPLVMMGAQHTVARILQDAAAGAL